MKKLTATILTLAMLCAVSCNGNTNVGDGATTSHTITETVTETTEAPVTGTTVAETEEPFDADAFLAECTVYEVTVDTQDSPLNELDKLDDADKPKKIALRFTDAENLTLLIDSGETVYGIHYYYVKHIFNDRVSFSLSNDGTIGYSKPDFSVKYNFGTTIVQTGNASGRVLEACIIKDGDYDIIRNYAPSSGCTLYVYIADDGGLEYSKTNEKYADNDFESFLMAYESDNDFYEERGRLVFENGKLKFINDITKTIGNGHLWSDMVDEYCEKHGMKSLSELAGLYKQYVAEGKQREFMRLD